jgi:His/Glu/Gln/Arg/opine family amino acid ABC transporter permease subunit
MAFEGITLFLQMLPAAVARTLVLTIGATAIGFACAASLLALARRYRLWAAFAATYSLFFRGTPLLVQLFLIYFGAAQFREALEPLGLWVLFREPWFCALLGLGLNTGAYGYEVLRGGLKNIPRGQIEAARAIGMTQRQVVWRIEAPIMTRLCLQGYLNEIVFLFQATSLVSLLTIPDITGIARAAAARTYQFYEVYLAAGCVYLVFVILLVQSGRILERRLSANMPAPEPGAMGGLR